MNPLQQSKTTRKYLLSLKERMQELGVQNDPLNQLDLELCFSPIEQVARQFILKLDRKLNRLELQHMLEGNDSVPLLDPDGSILIGHTVAQGLPCRIKIDDLTTHAVVSGASGSGKTTLIARMVDALLDWVKTILLDHKDEGLRFVDRMDKAAYIPLDRQRWNCLASSGAQNDYVRFLSTHLARVMSLLPVAFSAVQAKLLALCSDPANLPAVSDLPGIFLALARKDARSSLFTASRGFDDLSASMGRWAQVRKGRWPFADHPLCVIPLRDCPTSFESFFVAMLFRQLTDRATANGHTNALRHLLVFDEGRGFFGRELEPASGSGRINVQSTMLTKARSYGIGTIIGTQGITSIQQAVVDNAGIFIAMRTNSEQEAKASCRRLGLNDSRYMEFIAMDVGMAWVASPQFRQPVKIKVPFTDLGDYPGEAETCRRMKPLWDAWDQRTVFAPIKADGEAVLDFREILGEIPDHANPSSVDEEAATCDTGEGIDPLAQKSSDPAILSEYFALLRSCKAQPDFGVSSHYKALGWSGGRGNRVKNQLLELGWIEAVRVVSAQGGRPRETLSISPKGLEVLHESA